MSVQEHGVNIGEIILGFVDCVLKQALVVLMAVTICEDKTSQGGLALKECVQSF